MFEISQLKEMKLPELQEIAKKLTYPKYRSLKKLDLVYQILDQQAANPKAVEVVKAENLQKQQKKASKKTSRAVLHKRPKAQPKLNQKIKKKLHKKLS